MYLSIFLLDLRKRTFFCTFSKKVFAFGYVKIYEYALTLIGLLVQYQLNYHWKQQGRHTSYEGTQPLYERSVCEDPQYEVGVVAAI